MPWDLADIDDEHRARTWNHGPVEIADLKMAIEIVDLVDLFIKHMVDFSIVMS